MTKYFAFDFKILDEDGSPPPLPEQQEHFCGNGYGCAEKENLPVKGGFLILSGACHAIVRQNPILKAQGL